VRRDTLTMDGWRYGAASGRRCGDSTGRATAAHGPCSPQPSRGADVAAVSPSPGPDVAAVSPSPGADVAAVSPVPAQMSQGSPRGKTTGRVSAAIPRSCAWRSHPARSPRRSSAGDNISMQQPNNSTMQQCNNATSWAADRRCAGALRARVRACYRSYRAHGRLQGRLSSITGIASMCSMPPTKRSRAFPAPRPRACTPCP
jgi:hypothetical protein